MTQKLAWFLRNFKTQKYSKIVLDSVSILLLIELWASNILLKVDSFFERNINKFFSAKLFSFEDIVKSINFYEKKNVYRNVHRFTCFNNLTNQQNCNNFQILDSHFLYFYDGIVAD